MNSRQIRLSRLFRSVREGLTLSALVLAIPGCESPPLAVDHPAAPHSPLAVAATTVVTVHSQVPEGTSALETAMTFTGIHVEAGEEIHVTATGEVRGGPIHLGFQFFDANGAPAGSPQTSAGPHSGGDFPIIINPPANIFSLIGSIRDPDSGVPNQWFFIGTENTIVAPASGELVLLVHDALYRGDYPLAYRDNVGTFEVTIELDATADETPPVISGTVAGTLGDNGWYISDVGVSWVIEDPETGIVATSGCDDVSVTSDTGGIDFTCEATNGVGLQTSETVSIKRDATAPTVTYSGSAGVYTVAEKVDITCTAGDNLSGVALHTCADISGDAFGFGLGSHTFAATATDHAGNHGAGEVTFEVVVTYASLGELTSRFVENVGVARSMREKLEAAEAAEARGNLGAKEGQLRAYVNHVQAQSGKSLSPANAEILITLAQAL